MNNNNECNICYDVIGERNSCVTECGHKFCFKCIATSMQYRNSCPCCRATFVEEQEDDDDESFEYADEEDDDISLMSISELNVTDNEDDDDDFSDLREFLDFSEADVEEVSKKLEENNITMLDMVSLYLNRFNTDDKAATKSMINKVHKIVIEADNEKEEQNGMMDEDIASMSIELAMPPHAMKTI